LGWGLAASIGARQALNDTGPESDAIVACIIGDGSYLFGMPSASFWVAMRYKLPFLAVVLNNGGSSSGRLRLMIGWNAPKFSALGVNPTGFASKSSLSELNISLDPPADYGMIAEAAGAWSKEIKDIKELESGLQEAVKKVQMGQSAILNVFVND
jgi:acetolactate synthase I/II/III large subunit